MSNPFFKRLAEHGVPEFSRIQFAHYREAFDQGFAEQNEEIQAIIKQSAPADFINTIEALERSGALLGRVGDVFWNLTSSDTNDEIQALELELSAQSASHRAAIYANPDLFARVKAVVESKPELDVEQTQLLNETFQSFVRAGADLSEDARLRVGEIAGELATLSTQFGQNVLQDTNSFELILEAGEDIAGLPDFVLDVAKAEAESRGHSGKYAFTISRSSITPFLQYADKRELREKMYRAYTACGQAGADNHGIASEMVRLRNERASLLGYASHADFMLDDRMAKTPGAVRDLLDQVWEPSQRKVRKEAEDLQARIQADGGNFSLEAWDWWYYTEKVRKERFDLDEEAVKPYFKLENVRDGAFDVANKLYGIRFSPCDVPTYHPDVQAFAVDDANGSRIGIFMFDLFMRPSKRGGAWMSAFREQSAIDEHVNPVIVNCCNFPKSDPCLLGADEVRTLFHEFGHGLHGLLSRVKYESLSGTNVKMDFVELPSQIMEHWAMETQVLKSYATHYETGEPLPDALIEKLKASETFNQGFGTTEYLAACYLDFAWHESMDNVPESVSAFEASAMKTIDKIDMVDPRYKTSYFQHIFTGDEYSAGYYVYIWAEVLDADGFEAFKEQGIFDAETARAFRENILEKGGSVEPMTLYKQFRGRAPEVTPLLKNRGLV